MHVETLHSILHFSSSFSPSPSTPIFLSFSLNVLISSSCGSNLLFNLSIDFYILITSFIWLWRHIVIWFSSCISGCFVSVLLAGSSSSSLLLSDEVLGLGSWTSSLFHNLNHFPDEVINLGTSNAIDMLISSKLVTPVQMSPLNSWPIYPAGSETSPLGSFETELLTLIHKRCSVSCIS